MGRENPCSAALSFAPRRGPDQSEGLAPGSPRLDGRKVICFGPLVSSDDVSQTVAETRESSDQAASKQAPRRGVLDRARRGDRAGGGVGGAHLVLSNAFVRRNAEPEIVATMMKMMIDTAQARP